MSFRVADVILSALFIHRKCGQIRIKHFSICNNKVDLILDLKMINVKFFLALRRGDDIKIRFRYYTS